MSTMDVSQILNNWKKTVIEDYGVDRFKSNSRDDIIAMLFDDLIKFKILKDDAELLKRRVNEFLVTDEGKKGKGKHKGWNENVEMDFDAAIVQYYAGDCEVGSTTHIVKDYGNHPYMPYNPIMTAWAQDRFGIAWSNELNLMVHQQGGRFCHEFQVDVLDAKWVKTGENVPEWMEKVCKL